MLTKAENKRLKKLKRIYQEKSGNITLQQRIESKRLLEKSKPFVQRKEKVLSVSYCIIGVLIVLGGLGFYIHAPNYTTGSVCFCFGCFGLYIISNTLNRFTW
jgi:hypothetical protein